MKKDYAIYISVGIFVILGVLVFIVLQIREAGNENSSDAPVVRANMLQIREASNNSPAPEVPVMEKRVVDCSGIPPPMACRQIMLTSTIVNCNHWIPRVNALEELKCENTTKGLDQVNFISTSANHIRAKMTEETYQAEMLPNNIVWGGWELEFIGNGTFLITSINGRLYRYKEGMFRGIDGPQILRLENAGLLGLAIDPLFEQNKFIYLFYAYDYDEGFRGNTTRRILSRVSRFIVDNRTLRDEHVLLDKIPGDAQHVGGRIAIGPDGKLYVPTGDGGESMQSQNESSLLGKILRMNLDGSVPEDNPIYGSYVYSIGHRNPEGFAWDPESGYLFESEHGDVRKDEINLIRKGGNYGRGIEECGEENPDELYIDPLFCPRDWTLAPSGMAFVKDKDHPWYGSLFVASLQGRHLHRFIIQDGAIAGNEIFYYLNKTEKVQLGGNSSIVLERRIRDVAYYNGSLWVVFDSNGIVRITPPAIDDA